MSFYTLTNEEYSKAVENLKAVCAEAGVEVTRTRPHMDGFIVYFSGYDGDAAIHSGTYGHEANCFETYNMPWDHGDVTGWLTVDQLVYALVHGELEDET